MYDLPTSCTVAPASHYILYMPADMLEAITHYKKSYKKKHLSYLLVWEKKDSLHTKLCVKLESRDETDSGLGLLDRSHDCHSTNTVFLKSTSFQKKS